MKAVIAVLLSCALAPQAVAQPSSWAGPQRTLAGIAFTEPTIREEIEARNRSMMAAWQRGDAHAVAAHYAEDARIIGPSGETIEGRSQIDRYWQRFPMQGRTWTLEVLDAGGTRDLAYQWGRSTISGGGRSQTVDFVGVWKRQPNGELKLAIDYWGPSSSPAH